MRQGTGEGLGGGAGINENGRGGAGDEFDCFLGDEVFPPLGLLNGQLIVIVGVGGAFCGSVVWWGDYCEGVFGWVEGPRG